uniref:CR021 protein n=1 Tax=Anser cygnoides TaxID=8845 RepID=A0A8B9IJL8_ANSCY
NQIFQVATTGRIYIYIISPQVKFPFPQRNSEAPRGGRLPPPPPLSGPNGRRCPSGSPGGCRPAVPTPRRQRGRPAAGVPGLSAEGEAPGPVRARNHGAERGEPPPAHTLTQRGIRHSPSGGAGADRHGAARALLGGGGQGDGGRLPGTGAVPAVSGDTGGTAWVWGGTKGGGQREGGRNGAGGSARGDLVPLCFLSPCRWTLARRRDDEFGKERICPHCFQFLLPVSRRVRLKPKMKVTPQIEKILKREAKSYKLNMRQTKLLKKYRDSKSVLLITCTSCNKTTRRYGKSRDFLATKAQNSGTPTIKSSLRTPDVKTQSAKKMTPVSCSRLGSKGNTPSSLPRTQASRQVTTSSGSKTPRNSKFHFSKLKRMLNLEEKEKSQKADLKTFLTLL